MKTARETGSGLEIARGDHACGLFADAGEHARMLAAIVGDALESNARVLYMADAARCRAASARFSACGFSFDRLLGEGRLKVLGFDDAGIGGGALEPGRLLALFEAERAGAAAERYSGLLVVSEMSEAAIGVGNADRLAAYERAVTERRAKERCAVVCLYEKRQLAPELLLALLRTHPLLLTEVGPAENPHFRTVVGARADAPTLADVDRSLVELVQWRRAQQRYAFMRAFHDATDHCTELAPVLQTFILQVKRVTRCEAVGIRLLDDAGNIPYEAYDGFPRAFYESESPLSIARDQCMCTNVIKGDADPALPFYTEYGSFLMNGTSRFLATVSEADKGATRNVCNQMGYESVALVPIRRAGRIMGLIHLADRREEMVPLSTVRFLEEMAGALGPAIHRVWMQNDIVEAARQGAIDVVRDWVLVVDREHRVVQANRVLRQAFPDRPVIGEKCCRLLHGTDEPPPDCETCRVFDDGQPRQLEMRAERGGGRWLEISAYPLSAPDGRVEKVIHVCRDLTGHRTMEHALRDSEEKYRRLVENANDAIVITQDGRLTFANKQTERLSGYSHEDLLSVPFLNFVHSEDRKAVHEHHVRRLAGKEIPEVYDFRIVDRVGNTRWVRNSGVIVEWEGKPATLNFLADITARKHTEERLRESEARYRSFMENFEGIAYRGRLDWVPIFFHGTVEKITGYTEEDLVAGDPQWDQLIHPEDRAAIAESARRIAAESDYAVTREYRVVRKDGQTRWVREHIKNVCDRSGKPIYVQGVILDITEAKAAESELERYREGLERLVQDRTAKLDAINQELEAFTYSVSHDLRTPVRAITGFTRILVEEHARDLAVEGKDYLQRVHDAGQRMRALIEALLELSRLSQRRLQRRMVDLTALAQHCLAELEAAEPERKVSWAVAPELTADADPALAGAVLSNLLGNAWKFTRRRKRAKIEFGSIERDGVPVFFVRDNGVGFDMDYAARLFDPFKRFHEQAEFEGTGVGLATVRRIVVRHGGRLWAEAEEGKGATFFFSFGGEAGEKSEVGSRKSEV